MKNTLQSTTHDIKTVFGISIETNFLNEAEPTIWVMISAILLTIMRDNGYGLDIISCLTQLSLLIAGFSFIDDTDIINAAKSVNMKVGDLLA